MTICTGLFLIPGGTCSDPPEAIQFSISYSLPAWQSWTRYLTSSDVRTTATFPRFRVAFYIADLGVGKRPGTARRGIGLSARYLQSDLLAPSELEISTPLRKASRTPRGPPPGRSLPPSLDCSAGTAYSTPYIPSAGRLLGYVPATARIVGTRLVANDW